MKDFIEISESAWKSWLARKGGCKFVGNHSPDLDWWEAHAEFVVQTTEGVNQTIGYYVTSSYGAPTEYYVLESTATAEELNSKVLDFVGDIIKKKSKVR